MNRASALRVLATVGLLPIVLVSALWAQEPQPPAAAAPERRFEVASVKPNANSGDTTLQVLLAGGGAAAGASRPVIGIRTFPGGRFTANFVTLRTLILRAYDIRPYQLEGGPSWLDTDRFDINAIAGGDATDQEFNTMLRALLAERFTLRVRIETRPLPLHVLTVARADGRLGSSLKPSSPECVSQVEETRRKVEETRRLAEEQRASGQPPPQPPAQAARPAPPAPRTPEEIQALIMAVRCGGMGMSNLPSRATHTMGGQSLSSLVSRLSTELNAPVEDQTGLTGLYDMILEYEPVRRSATARPGLDPNSTESPAPPLQLALQQQLGLRLEETRAPLPVVIIEGVEQPTPD